MNKLNASETFQNWYNTFINTEFRESLSKIYRKNLKILKDQIVSNVNSSGFRKSSEIAKGAVITTNSDNNSAKVHILGQRGNYAGYLRIFELGTYKKQYKNGRIGIKPYRFFSNALASSANSVWANLKQSIESIKK